MRRFKSINEAISKGQNAGFIDMVRPDSDAHYTVEWRLQGDVAEWKDENSNWDCVTPIDLDHIFRMGVSACAKNFSIPQDIIEELR